jgi:hypothetical protein
MTMVTLIERLTGPADAPEETPVTTPRPFAPAVPGASQVPWWTGVPGLDPDVRYQDWVYLTAAKDICSAGTLR